jgi:small nuclear ribonucleoprotein (snRNP)-like protein
MKKLLFIALLSLASVAYGQTETAKVTLKNGTMLVGEIKSFDPLKQITLVIAGNPVEIQMSDILKVEQNGANGAPTAASTTVQGPYNDQGNYPDSIKVKVGEFEIILLLVRGGDFMMGYDGHHSLSMNSEPVHKVKLTTYYISENLISNEQYAALAKLDFKEKKQDGSRRSEMGCG